MKLANEHGTAQINIQTNLTEIKSNDFLSFVQVSIKGWKMYSDQQQSPKNVKMFTFSQLNCGIVTHYANKGRFEFS